MGTEELKEIAFDKIDIHWNDFSEGSYKAVNRLRDECFIAGYNEAMRWRHPIAEKPEIFETVFVKAERRWEGRSTETFYTTSSRLGSYFKCEGSEKMYDGSYSQVEVIGWRPIK